MEATIAALGGILLNAIPTFILVILLHFYLKYVFFKPLERVLHERYEATEGARKRAEESLERATAKTAEYEAAMRAARAEVYQAQEQLHKQLEAQRAADAEAARARAEETVRQAKEMLAAETAEAKRTLSQESDVLAGRIVESILKRRVA